MFDKEKSFLKDESANTILMLVFMAIGILILIVVVTLLPAVAYNVQSSVTIPAASVWAGTTGGVTFTNGSSMWSQLSPMISTTALVSIVGVLIAVLLGALAVRQKQ